MRDNYHGFFFGQGALWVTAWWVEEQTLDWVRENDRTKYGSITIQDGMVTDELGPPRVEGTRLDGEGEASGGTGGYATSMGESGTTLNWWPTTIDFPSLGCWQITETVGDTSITYVVQL